MKRLGGIMEDFQDLVTQCPSVTLIQRKKNYWYHKKMVRWDYNIAHSKGGVDKEWILIEFPKDILIMKP